MSYEASGIFFQNQIASSKGMRAFARKSVADGVLQGCTITVSGSTATISSGYFIAAGALCNIPNALSITLDGSYAYNRIVANIDLTKAATTSEFKQAYFTVDGSATDSWSALTQDDINVSGTLYQIEFAVIKISDSTVERRAVSSFFATPTVLTSNQYGTALPTAGTAGRIFFLKV